MFVSLGKGTLAPPIAFCQLLQGGRSSLSLRWLLVDSHSLPRKYWRPVNNMGFNGREEVWVGVTLQASDSGKNLVALRYEPISRIPGWWAVLPDFAPNWATFNHVRLGKLSLGGIFAQSGNAVDNKPALPALPLMRRKAGAIIWRITRF